MAMGKGGLINMIYWIRSGLQRQEGEKTTQTTKSTSREPPDENFLHTY